MQTHVGAIPAAHESRNSLPASCLLAPKIDSQDGNLALPRMERSDGPGWHSEANHLPAQPTPAPGDMAASVVKGKYVNPLPKVQAS